MKTNSFQNTKVWKTFCLNAFTFRELIKTCWDLKLLISLRQGLLQPSVALISGVAEVAFIMILLFSVS